MATEQTPAPIDRKGLRSQRLREVNFQGDALLLDMNWTDVVITPHAAYYSEEAISTVRRFAAEEVVRVLTGRPPLSPVNAAELVEARWSRSR
jgi:lactate dehydrogenase-like 2-hydroxyacid dehydrogenase